MKCQYYYFLVSSLIFSELAWGQTAGKAIQFSPMEPPLHLSGTFGELRTNHFHAGVDLRTGEEIGKPIYAVQGGFVSRIKISPVGYGLALYIDHPTGHTTVYAHLEAYHGAIAEWVFQAQSKTHSWALDTLLSPEALPIEGGERVATSGNSGGSAGPHLHFEVRDTETEHALNPLEQGLRTEDRIPPTLRAVHFLDASGRRKKYTSGQQDTISVISPVGIALDVYDKQFSTGPTTGVFRLEQHTQRDHFAYSFSRFSFDDGRACNATMDYPYSVSHGTRLYRMFRQPFHPGPLFESVPRGHDGRLVLDSGTYTKVVWRVWDGHQQQDTAGMVLYCAKTLPYIPPKPDSGDSLSEGTLGSVRWAPNTFYRKTKVTLNANSSGMLQAEWSGPVHLPVSVAIPLPDSHGIQKNRALVWTTASGKKQWFSPQLSGKMGIIFVKEPGAASWQTDHFPPVLSGFTSWRTRLNPGSRLYFTATDVGLGIASYGAWLNDSLWIPVAYDAKYKRMWVDIPKALSSGSHTLQIYVIDGAGQKAHFLHSFNTL